MNRLSSLKIEDGQLVQVIAQPTGLLLELEDASNHRILVRFRGVWAFMGINISSTDLSHFAEVATDDWISWVIDELEEESLNRVIGYYLYEAWDDKPILRILAEECSIES